MSFVRSRFMWGTVLVVAVLVGLMAGWMVGGPRMARSVGTGTDHGPRDNPTALLQATDPLTGTVWKLVTYVDGESGWTCLDTMAYGSNGSPVAGGGGCDLNYPPPLPASGTATVAYSGGVLLPVPDPNVGTWYGSAWGRVNCTDCNVIVTWIGGATTTAAKSGGYWLSYQPVPSDQEDALVTSVTVQPFGLGPQGAGGCC